MRGRVSALLAARPAAKAVNPRAIRLIEFALVVAIAGVIGANIWVLRPVPAPPRAPTALPARAEPAARSPNNPFRTSAAPAAAVDATPADELADTSLQLTLHGTWVDANGGAAIIGTPDDKQARFAPGDTITAGVTLDRVERDQVVILRNGVREALRLIKRVAGAEPQSVMTPQADAGPSSQADAMVAQGAAMISDLVLAMPSPDERGRMRIELQPAGDPAAFEELGLRPGDTIVAVNNQQFGGDIAQGLEAIAASNGKFPVTMTVERRGVAVPITINEPVSAPAEGAAE